MPCKRSLERKRYVMHYIEQRTLNHANSKSTYLEWFQSRGGCLGCSSGENG